MSRHAKNNTASAVFTHYERSKLKYGTQKQRVSKDSVKTFDCCCLCLHPIVNPVSCHKGHMYCKECIYGSLLSQKKDIKRQQKAFDAQEMAAEKTAEVEQIKAREAEVQAFDKIENGLLPVLPRVFKAIEATQGSYVPEGFVSTTNNQGKTYYIDAEQKDLVNDQAKYEALSEQARKAVDQGKMKLNAFWMPSLIPDALATKVKRPSKDTFCPEGKHTLRLKQLVDLKFAPDSNSDEKDPNHVHSFRFCCPVCRKTLTNAPKAVVLKQCGHVLCLNCSEKFTGSCNVCDTPFRSEDVIRLQCGGTGYAGHGEELVAKKVTPAAIV